MQAARAPLPAQGPRAPDLHLEGFESKVFNTEIVAALELQNMLEVAETVAVSARWSSQGIARRPHLPRLIRPRRPELPLSHPLLIGLMRWAAPRSRRKSLGSLGARGAEVLMAESNRMTAGRRSRASIPIRTRSPRPRSTRSLFRTTGRSWTRSTTSRTKSTDVFPIAGRVEWRSAAAAG